MHRMGYQNLRCMPYLNPLGYRFAIAPKSLFSERNGAVIPWDKLGSDEVAITGAGDYFGWSDTKGDNARELAEKFISRFPEIASRGKGRDWAYVGWLAELVGFLEQGDWVPVVWWETMKDEPETLKALPIWSHGQENFYWDGEESFISPANPEFPLPPAGYVPDLPW